MSRRSCFARPNFHAVCLATLSAVFLAAGCPVSSVPSSSSSITGVLAESALGGAAPGGAARAAPLALLAPADRVVHCSAAEDIQQALTAWLDSATIADGCGNATVTNDFSSLPT